MFTYKCGQNPDVSHTHSGTTSTESPFGTQKGQP